MYSKLQCVPEYTQYYRVFHSTLNTTGCFRIYSRLQGVPEYTQYSRCSIIHSILQGVPEYILYYRELHKKLNTPGGPEYTQYYNRVFQNTFYTTGSSIKKTQYSRWSRIHSILQGVP